MRKFFGAFGAFGDGDVVPACVTVFTWFATLIVAVLG